ncbi:MAG: hypothetical protein RBT82_07390 [Desulfomonilia bacterium]|nr:hypothetical protein [Desulfomonilia bacterium]
MSPGREVPLNPLSLDLRLPGVSRTIYRNRSCLSLKCAWTLPVNVPDSFINNG